MHEETIGVIGSPDAAIRIEQLSKCYRIGMKEHLHDSIGSAFLDFIRSPVKNYRNYRSLYQFDELSLRGKNDSGGGPADILWALKDVSFDVRPGEVVGIIGRNGAGKSTLLKILSRITHPTLGQIEVRGRISSLLEVGTGFHPELTGRENIYLNGTILGMRKSELDHKFSDIVEFSGIDKFIDTPVKRYSSGMKVRLAFSVAAHLEPEILIIDEVLAVGDAEFQKKCLSRMEDVGKSGRTVLFVSHNMPAVSRLCDRVILMNDGQVVDDGVTHDVIGKYLSAGTHTMAMREWADPAVAPGSEVARLRAVRVKTDGKISETADIREPVVIEMEYDVLQPGHVLLPNFNFFNDEGIFIFKALDQDPMWRGRPRPVGQYVSSTSIPGNFLSEGMVFVTAASVAIKPRFMPQYYERDIVAFQVVDTADGDSARGDYVGRVGGVVRPLLQWVTEYKGNGAIKLFDK